MSYQHICSGPGDDCIYANTHAMKALPCVACGMPQAVDPSVERVWCSDCAKCVAHFKWEPHHPECEPKKPAALDPLRRANHLGADAP